MSSRAALFKKSATRNYEFERYLTSTEPNSDVVLDCTNCNYVITLPLSYFVSKQGGSSRRRSNGKADAMPYESFRTINAQHRLTFEFAPLVDGLGIVPVVMGLFGVGEVLNNTEQAIRRQIVSA